MAQVSKDELMHIAKLANLKLNDDEVDVYLENLKDILDFANIVNETDVTGLDVTIGANDAFNVFRKDEINVFEDNCALLQNAPESEQNMFKIPKVI